MAALFRWLAALAWAGCALALSDAFLPLGRDEVIWRGITVRAGREAWVMAVRAALRGLGSFLQPAVPRPLQQWLRRTAGRLGPAVVAEEALGLAAAAGLAGSGWLVLGGGDAGSGMGALAVRAACGLALGSSLVLAGLQVRAGDRQARLARDLPALVDLLLLGLEGGLNLSGALTEAAQHVEDPLREELRLVEQRVKMGLTRHQALTEFAERLDLRELSTLVTLLNQAETLGSGVTKAVAAIARRLRTGRVLAAERRAGEAPVKMLFPLVFCLFPSILVLLVGPVLLGRGALFGW
jgi:tight adherence protein C